MNVSSHGPNSRKKTHQERNAGWPLSAVGNAFETPYNFIGVELVDRASRQPNTEDYQSDQVDSGADFVQLCWELGRVHREEAIYNK